MSPVGGCGTYVPFMEEVTDQREGKLGAGGVLEENIKIQVYCELKAAVLTVTDPDSPYYLGLFRKGHATAALPDDWGVEVTLTLEVDENSALNPSVALSTFSPASFTLGLGGTLTSTASRIDKFTYFYLIKDLRTPIGTADRCFYDQDTGERRNLVLPGSSLLIRSDLRMAEWLYSALHVEANYKSEATDPAKKDDVYSYDVKFVVVTSGTANPAWKLLRISTNQSGSPLLGAGRTRSHDLLMTFGPTEKPKNGARTLSTAASNSHLASQIGTAVSNAIRGPNLNPPF
jgi:hypothetical protein